jgi:prepilin-type N-terminal cleavage/methylation domain-containing protein
MRRKHSGFTLIELMIVLVILAVLTLVAIPNFQRLVDKNRLRDATGPFVTGLNLARSEAIKLGNTVDLCPGTVTACDYSASTDATDWAPQGWTMIENANVSVLRSAPGAHQDVTVAGSLVERIRYRPSGLVTMTTTNDTTTVTSEQTFTWQSDCWQQVVTVGVTGSVTTDTPDFIGGGC